MKKLAGLLLLMLLLTAAGCTSASANAEAQGEIRHIIGVAVYSSTDDEVLMFRHYYQNYIEAAFPVDFVYSNAIRSAADEQEFIRQAKAAGAGGIISFITYDLPAAVQLCGQEDMYYMMGSSTVSEEDFAAVAADPAFLGVIGPDSQDEYQAGYDMALHFAKLAGEAEREPVCLLVTGGAASGNVMHAYRAQGMLAALAEVYGYQYDLSLAEILAAEEPLVLQTGQRGVKVYIYPGYVRSEDYTSNLAEFLQFSQADVLLDVMTAADALPAVSQVEAANGYNIWVGTVDCFSESSYIAFTGKDPLGNPQLDYLAGKYASMIGPAFAAMFNALEGDGEFMRSDGQAFRLHQGFWVAAEPASFLELYACTHGIYVNAYSDSDLQQVIRAYNPAATLQDLAELTEAYGVEAVKARIASR